jgi:hypothetical protein
MGRYDPLRLKALKALYEETEDGRVYAWNTLAEIMVKCGASSSYAKLLIWDFHLVGVLERPKPGLYKINREKLKAYIEEYEATLEKMKAKRGGGSGGGPEPG